MAKKKTYVVLIVIFLVFFLIMFAMFGVDNLRKEKYNTTIIVGDNTVWTLNKKSWMDLSNSASVQDFNWEEFKVYVNNEKLGNYLLWHSDKWYVFDKDKNAIPIDGNLVAYRANYNIPIYNFNEEEITDYSVVNQVLAENDIEDKDKFTSSYKVVFDYDNDLKEEEFYVVSNAFPLDFDPKKIFSIVFMVDDDKIYPIYTDVSNNTSFNGCKPYFTSFLDVDNDKKYELVLSCSAYSISNTVNMLYDFSDEEFKIIISNQ